MCQNQTWASWRQDWFGLWTYSVNGFDKAITQSQKLWLPLQQPKMRIQTHRICLSSTLTSLSRSSFAGIQTKAPWMNSVAIVHTYAFSYTEKNFVAMFFAHLHAAVGWYQSASLPDSRSPVLSHLASNYVKSLTILFAIVWCLFP